MHKQGRYMATKVSIGNYFELARASHMANMDQVNDFNKLVYEFIQQS